MCRKFLFCPPNPNKGHTSSNNDRNHMSINCMMIIITESSMKDVFWIMTEEK